MTDSLQPTVHASESVRVSAAGLRRFRAARVLGLGVLLTAVLFQPALAARAPGHAARRPTRNEGAGGSAPEPAGAPAQPPAAPAPATTAPARPAPSAGNSAQPIDKVVAVVNDETILLSEVQEQMALFQAAQQVEIRDSTQAAALQKQILDQLIEEKLIVDYALKQGITVSDDEINKQVEDTINQVKQRLGSEEAFQKELKSQGLTIDTLRDRYRQDIRKQMLAQRIVDKEIRNKVKVTDADVDTFFKNNQDKIPPKPAQYHLAHILVIAKADANRRAQARAKANDVLRQLEAGGDWNKLAAQYSDDTQTKNNGGDLGEVQDGEFDEQFEAAVRDLKPGQRTGIVETRFGFHIIELVSREDNHYHPRHILIQATPTPMDKAAAIERAAKARDQALKGADWSILVNSYSDDPSTKEKAGDLGLIPVTALSPDYVQTLDSLKTGQISPVMEGPTGYHIFKLLGKETGGAYKLDEIRPQLMQELMKMKLSEEYDRWIQGIRKKAFVEIKS